MELNPFVVGVIAIGIIMISVAVLFYYNVSKIEKEVS